jgi:N-acetylglucosamine-6-phosphate deacetylase
MTLTGVDVSTGAHVAISFEKVIRSADALISETPDAPLLAPGFIDLQVNGFAGVDYNSPEAPLEEIAQSIRVMFSTGVTRFLPTVITGDPQAMTGALRNLAKARETLPEGRAIEGFHVEGPHISPEDGPRGAHPREWVRPPDIEEFHRWQEAAEGAVRLVTVSPEWPGTPRYIEALVNQGVVVSIGHTKATTAQIQDAVSAGATKSTHLGNGAHAMIQRHPNYIWDQLAEDRLAAGFIVDGIHLPASFLRAAIRAKGIERSILVTDAVMPAGCPPGRFRIGGVDIELHPDNRVTLAGLDRLAGSALRMDRGIENLMRLAGLSLPQAMTMATRNPARVGRIAGRQRGLTPGDRADVVEFRYHAATNSIEILRTFLDGDLVWSRERGAAVVN